MAEKIREVYELEVYQLAEKLGEKIWFGFDGWSRKVQNTIGSQIIRAADSISANIAEGFGRYGINDKRKFYIYARGSFEETKSWLRKLIKRKIINKKETNEFAEIINELGPKLNAFISKTK